jgi:hypothetical protein
MFSITSRMTNFSLFVCEQNPGIPHLQAGVTGGHGLHAQRRAHNVPVRAESLLGGPGPIAFPRVAAHAELVLRVVVQAGKDRLAARGAAHFLLVGIRSLPELDLVQHDLTVARVFRRWVVDNLHDVRRLKAPGDVLWRVGGHALGCEVGDDGLLAGADAVDAGHAELILDALLQARDLLVAEVYILENTGTLRPTLGRGWGYWLMSSGRRI